MKALEWPQYLPHYKSMVKNATQGQVIHSGKVLSGPKSNSSDIFSSPEPKAHW